MAKILIAEDEPDIRDLIIFTLRFAGYEACHCSSVTQTKINIRAPIYILEVGSFGSLDEDGKRPRPTDHP